jgi:hypothetical protein
MHSEGIILVCVWVLGFEVFHELLGRPLRFVTIHVHDGNIGSAVDQCLGHDQAQPSGATSYNSDASLE